MKNEELTEIEDRRRELIKKIMIWISVLFISVMLVLLLIIQPSFYSFLD